MNKAFHSENECKDAVLGRNYRVQYVGGCIGAIFALLPLKCYGRGNECRHRAGGH
jgi:hypothetical protein